MKEIFVGFLVISGLVVILYTLLICTGFITLFLSNCFSSTHYAPYTMSNIKTYNGKGLLILAGVSAFLIVSHIIGKIVTI